MDYANTYKVLVSFLVDGISQDLLNQRLTNGSNIVGLDCTYNQKANIRKVRKITPIKITQATKQTPTALTPTLKVTLMLMAEIRIDVQPKKWSKYIMPTITTIGLGNGFNAHTFQIEKCSKILY